MTRDSITIPLTQGLSAIIDAEDYPLISKYKWFAVKSCATHYAAAYNPKTQISITMHRIILNAQHGQQIDHANHNGLDNRKCNIRFSTQSQNIANARLKKTHSVYRGVSRAKKLWRYDCKSGDNRYWGYCKTELEAALAYNNIARKAHGKFAQINTIPLV